MPKVDSRMGVLVEDIAQYFKDHPNAADTVDGVIQWWLARQRYANDPARVAEALEALVKAARIVKGTLPDGTVLYRNSPSLNKRHH